MIPKELKDTKLRCVFVVFVVWKGNSRRKTFGKKQRTHTHRQTDTMKPRNHTKSNIITHTHSTKYDIMCSCSVVSNTYSNDKKKIK